MTYQPAAFEEVGEQAGVNFTHYRDLLDIIPLGAGVVVFDYNGDGRQDIYVTSTPDLAGLAPEGEDENALFANNGNGTFSNVTGAAGVADAEAKGNGGCAADYDNDGDQDLFVANWGASRLFRNDGEGRFTDAAESAGLSDPDATYRSMGCAWGDYDRDGALDFVVVRHIDESNPDAFTKRLYFFDVRPLALFHNNNDGTFTEVTHLLGATANPSHTGGEYGSVWGAGFQPAWVDFDNDGDLDLYVINDFGEYIHPNVLWRNDGLSTGRGGAEANGRGGAGGGEWAFTDVSQESGAGAAMFGMGLAVADYNSDGYLDLFVTNIGDNVLLTTRDGRTFRDNAATAGVASGEFRRQQRVSWGTVFFDYDNDGFEDLYLASGYLDTDDINRREQPNLLFRNNGDGSFGRRVGHQRGRRLGNRARRGLRRLQRRRLPRPVRGQPGPLGGGGRTGPAVSQPLRLGQQLAYREDRRHGWQPRRHRRQNHADHRRAHPDSGGCGRRQQLVAEYAPGPLRLGPSRSRG